MAKPWSEVAASPEFQALSPQDQDAARTQYFDSVVAPQVPADSLDAARTQFNSDTGFQSTPGGAAVGNPRIAAQGAGTLRAGDETIGQRAATIAGAGAAMGAAGALTPEIMTGISAGLSAFPATAPAGAAMKFMPTLAKGLAEFGTKAYGSRAAGAASGAIAGTVGESAGQIAEQLGAGTAAAEATRFAAAGVAPEFGRLAIWAAKGIKDIMPLSQSGEIARVVAKMGGREEDLTAEQKKFLEGLITDLRGGAKTDAPLAEVGGALKTGANEELARGAKAAQYIIANAETSARNEIESAMRGPIARAYKGIETLPALKEQAIAVGKNARLGIGNDREMTQIGEGLRDVTNARRGVAIKAKNDTFAADEKARNDIVAAKEKAGVYLEALPEYKALMQELDAKLLTSKKARMATNVNPVQETGVARDYGLIRNAIQAKRVPVSEAEAKDAAEAGLTVVNGTNPVTGEPQAYREFANSFEALDHLRRRLGDVFTGQPAEDYAALGEAISRKYYGIISDIQKKYVGGGDNAATNVQIKLLENYANSKAGLEAFGSKAGKRMTAVDRTDFSKFQNDAASITKQFFTTQRGVKDLVELTGDKELVRQAAKDYATNQLTGMDEKQVRDWMLKNRDWLQEPSVGMDVRNSVENYANVLKRSEHVAAGVDAGMIKLGKRTDNLEKTAAGRAAKIQADAEAQASARMSDATATAKTMRGDAGDVARAIQLIESGSPEQWATVGPAIQQIDMEKAVRQVMAEKAGQSTKGITAFFDRKVRDPMEKMGFLGTAAADDISARLGRIENMRLPEPERLRLVKRVLYQAVGGEAASLAARGGVAGYRSLVDQIPQ